MSGTYHNDRVSAPDRCIESTRFISKAGESKSEVASNLLRTLPIWLLGVFDPPWVVQRLSKQSSLVAYLCIQVQPHRTCRHAVSYPLRSGPSW
jgi:hypothetical protein